MCSWEKGKHWVAWENVLSETGRGNRYKIITGHIKGAI
ncbi:hypothetical protein RDI58_028540 [Solanum bulbocastanum]|uniref:Uncharacterized protein n=1 Tax=Solanum bulbocastanum TaxID=147425 RepID=A0AAN8ST19_SOLBU